MDSQSSLATGPPFRPPIEIRAPLFTPAQRKVIQTLAEGYICPVATPCHAQSKNFRGGAPIPPKPDRYLGALCRTADLQSCVPMQQVIVIANNYHCALTPWRTLGALRKKRPLFQPQQGKGFPPVAVITGVVVILAIIRWRG